MCQIYKSEENREMYLYVDKKQGLEAVPDALLGRFGKALALMVLLLEPGKKLARANIDEVMAQILENGFYLQMPPTAAQLFGRDGNNLDD
jgi:uncharacterized protein YcgL (UPF0745 family)